MESVSLGHMKSEIMELTKLLSEEQLKDLLNDVKEQIMGVNYMGKKRSRELKVVIINPEAIEGAKRRSNEIIFELYMKAIKEGRIKPIK